MGIIWLNDEVDGNITLGGDTVQASLDPLDAFGNPVPTNAQQLIVTGPRDLENFARLWVYIGGLQTALTSGNIQVGLQWQAGFTGAPSINVYLSADVTGSSSYLTDPTGVAEQAQISSPYGAAIVDVNGKKSVDTSGTFILPASAWASLSQTNPIGHFLFEGMGEGAGQLTIVFLDKSGSQIGQGPGVWMDLKDIKELYERWTVGDGPTGALEGGGGAPAATAGISNLRLPSGVQSGLTYSSTASGLSVPTDPNGNKYILFVHGWNLFPWKKDAFAETMLKRLYWQGYKGKFGTFQWPTTYYEYKGAALLALSCNDDGEFSAWQSAVPLEQLLVTLHSPNAYGNNVYLFAHSMGNMVVGEALRIAGQTGTGQLVQTYVASQAAVPGHCYDPSLASVDLNPLVTQATPNIYNSWLLPPNPSVGARSNYYNTNDFALRLWRLDQALKPDHFINGYTYYYDSSDYSFVQDLFKKAALPPLDPTALHLGDVNNVQDRYEIMAYAAQPLSLALGAVSDVSLNTFGPSQNLQDRNVWPADTFDQPNGPYSAHVWHSAEFLLANSDQQTYWHALLNQFQLLPSQ